MLAASSAAPSAERRIVWNGTATDSGALTYTRMRIARVPPSTWSRAYRDVRVAVMGGRASRCRFLMLDFLVRRVVEVSSFSSASFHGKGDYKVVSTS